MKLGKFFAQGFWPENDCQLLTNGEEAYPSMLAEIERASHFILFEVYIFRQDSVGEMFVQAFLSAAQRGVKVLLHVDGFGSLGSRPYLESSLQHPNLLLRFFHPFILRWQTLHYFRRRNHRKILVCDQNAAFLGGINIGEEYLFLSPDGKNGYRDSHLRIQGPAILELIQKFLALWPGSKETEAIKKIFSDSGGIRKKSSQPGQITGNPFHFQKANRAFVKIVSNNLFFKRFVVRYQYRSLMRHAQSFVYITNPYFIPDRWLLYEVYRACKRGVQVHILLPSRNDILLAGWAMENLYDRLLSWGVRIFAWKGFVHAKTAIADRHLSIIGSFNWDHLSLFKNLEIVAVIADVVFAQKLESLFLQDVQNSVELNLQQWRQRPWYFRLREKMAYLLRWWL